MYRFFSLLLLLLLPGFQPSPAHAAQAHVPLAPGVDLDQAGESLRQAMAAYEAAVRAGVPEDWALTEVAANRPARFGTSSFMILSDIDGDTVQLVVVGGEQPARASIRAGGEHVLGPLKVILISTHPERGSAQFLIKGTNPAPLLIEDASKEKSGVRLRGFENPNAIMIEADDARIVRFGERFLQFLNDGETPEFAAREARKAIPPAIDITEKRAPVPRTPELLDDYPAMEAPLNAVVTLRLVRGESSAVRQLLSDFSYDSSGNSPDDPRVRGRSGTGGGTVEVGRPGDRIQARIDALEASGKLNVESETFVRVPIGGESYFSIMGPSGVAGGSFFVMPRGRDRVEVEIDQESGDWGFLGAVRTRAIFRDGQTISLAKSSFSRSTSMSSKTPILSGIPYIGSIFSNEQSTSQSSDYALLATVNLE